jgi:hypothetical protein
MRIRFTVDLDGHPRSLFSAVKGRDEITLGLKSEYINDRQGDALRGQDVPKQSPSEVIEHRYSIHPSHQSKQNINVVKQTMLMANGRKLSTRHHTKVIKSGRNFALIFCF